MKNLVNKETKEIGLKIVFKLLLKALFLIFLINSGIVTFKAGQVLISISFFILTAVSIVPHRYFRITATLKWVIVIILCTTLLSISGSKTPPKEQKYQNYELSEKIDLKYGNNTFSMVIREAKHDAKISVSGKEVATSGYFIIVTGDIVNLGSEAVNFKFGKDPELKDGQNRLYTLYGTGLAVGKLQPSVAKEISYVFEIPKDATGLKFIVRDKTDIAKSIDLTK